MAKDKERKLAKKLYMQHKTGKEIAVIVKVQEKTISNWVNTHGWRQERDARVNSSQTEISNLQIILSDLTEKKIENMKAMKLARAAKDYDQIEQLQGIDRSIADQHAKWSKRLREIEGNNKVPLATYIHVMEDVFKGLQRYSPELFLQTIDFQEKHLEDVATKLSL